MNGLGFNKEGKNDMQVLTFLKDWDVDFIGFAKINICWKKILHNQRLWDRTKGWFDERSFNVENDVNKLRESKRSQPGG